MQIPELSEPSTRDELLRGLRALHGQSTEVWDALSTEELFTSQGEKWSPAQHLDHLTRSNGPVGKALAIPKAALLLRFGPALSRSRSFSEVVTVYHEAVDSGAAQARGPYRPSAPEPPEDPEAARRQMMARRERAAERLHRQIEGWGDTALDRLRLPHPVIGKLTVREMLYFTLYHNHHHLRRVVERRA